MRDISEQFEASAEALIVRHERRIQLMLEAMQTANAEFATDLTTLAATTEAQIRNRVRAVRDKQQEMTDHLSGRQSELRLEPPA